MKFINKGVARRGAEGAAAPWHEPHGMSLPHLWGGGCGAEGELPVFWSTQKII